MTWLAVFAIVVVLLFPVLGTCLVYPLILWCRGCLLVGQKHWMED